MVRASEGVNLLYILRMRLLSLFLSTIRGALRRFVVYLFTSSLLDWCDPAAEVHTLLEAGSVGEVCACLM